MRPIRRAPSLFYFLIIMISGIFSYLAFAKDYVRGYPYREVDSFYSKFSLELQQMVEKRGGDFFKEVDPSKFINGDKTVSVSVAIHKSSKKIDSKEKALFSSIDFNGDLEYEGGIILSKFSFVMPRRSASFYTIEQQMSEEHFNNILINSIIESSDFKTGQLSVKRLLNIDIPIFGGEKVIPLSGHILLTDLVNLYGSVELKEFIQSSRTLDKNLSKMKSNKIYIATKAKNQNDLIKGVSAYISYYHLDNHRDLVVGYQLARMNNIPTVPFMTNKIIDRLENRTRMEIAYLIFQFSKI